MRDTRDKEDATPHGAGFLDGPHDKEPLLGKAHLLTKAEKKPRTGEGRGFPVWSGEFDHGIGKLWLFLFYG